MSNAVKFTPAGGQIQVEVERDEGSVIIKVADTDIGICEELLPRIFDRFEQGESGTARRHTGLGLGLAIAKQLVELHGGSIHATSEGVGKGACFSVRLPLRVEPVELDGPRLPRADDRVALDALRILFIEDETQVRDATRRFLESSGADVLAVDFVRAAREAFARERPDIVVSDIGLPGEDGYQLMRDIRVHEAKEGTARVPALAPTAFAREDDRQRCLQAGYDAHLAKPVDPEQVLQQIARLTWPARRVSREERGDPAIRLVDCRIRTLGGNEQRMPRAVQRFERALFVDQ